MNNENSVGLEANELFNKNYISTDIPLSLQILSTLGAAHSLFLIIISNMIIE